MGQLAFGSFELVLNVEVFVLHPKYGEFAKRGSTVTNVCVFMVQLEVLLQLDLICWLVPSSFMRCLAYENRKPH